MLHVWKFGSIAGALLWTTQLPSQLGSSVLLCRPSLLFFPLHIRISFILANPMYGTNAQLAMCTVNGNCNKYLHTFFCGCWPWTSTSMNLWDGEKQSTQQHKANPPTHILMRYTGTDNYNWHKLHIHADLEAHSLIRLVSGRLDWCCSGLDNMQNPAHFCIVILHGYLHAYKLVSETK